MGLVLYVTLETLRIAAILLQPVMPASMGRLLDLLGVPPEARDIRALDAGEAERAVSTLRIGSKPGRALPRPTAVFPRYVETEAAK